MKTPWKTALSVAAALLLAPTAHAEGPEPWWGDEPETAPRSGVPSPRVAPSKKRSESVGAANKGRLRRGAALPSSGPGFVRVERDTHYGTDETVALLRYLGARYAEAFPGTAPLVIGDLSAKGGGRLRPHGSHRTGRDVDIGYPEKGNVRRRGFRRGLEIGSIDWEKTWFVLESLLVSGQVRYIFVVDAFMPRLVQEALRAGWTEQELDRWFLMPDEKPRRGAVRHARGHVSHFHVRFVCPAGDDACEMY